MVQAGVSSVKQFSLLLELSRAFSALIELEALLPFLMAKTKEVFEAESCALLLLDDEKQELYFPVISDLNAAVAERLKGIRFPADKGVAGWVLQQGRPLRVPDVEDGVVETRDHVLVNDRCTRNIPSGGSQRAWVWTVASRW